MWTQRPGPMRAKQLMFTGDMIDGRPAVDRRPATLAALPALVEAKTLVVARRIAGVPRSHLVMHKLVVNQAMLTMGLEQTQMFATLFDGVTCDNPEGLRFRREAQVQGARLKKRAVQWRDSGRPAGRPIAEDDEARTAH